MVCAIHKFKKPSCKCHRLGRFHETLKSKRSRGAHKGNLHTMLACSIQHALLTIQNTLKGSLDSCTGVLAYFCLFLLCICAYLCIWIHIRVCLDECMHPGCPLLNLSILPRRANFSFSLDAHFNPRFFPQMNENCKQLQKCIAASHSSAAEELNCREILNWMRI